MQVLDDPDRAFASSVFVKLETLPKATFNRQRAERKFYNTFFDEISKWAEVDDALVQAAFDVACKVGLSAMDALHVAAAHQVGANELVTAGKPTKPLLRVTLMPVVTIQPARSSI